MRGLKRWGCFFLAVSALFLVVSGVSDLRLVDPIYVPTTVLLVAACLVPAATAAGSEIRTVEGLGTESEPSDVQRALASCAVQCGFCLPGMAMTVHDLLEGNHAPTELQTRQALCGNLCRCSGYRGVLDAVRTVIEERAERAERAEQQSPRIPQQAGPFEGDA